MLNNLQLYKGPWHSGLTDSAKLSNVFLTEPEKVSTVISYVFGYWYEYGFSPLQYLTKGMGRTKEINNREYEWQLMGEIEKSVPVVENVDSLNTTPGIGHTTFRVKLAEEWFAKGEILIPDDRDFPCRVMLDPVSDGDGFIYTLALNTADSEAFMPTELLEPGKQFSKDFSAVEEFSDYSGITNYASPFTMRNKTTTMRKEYSITGSASTDVMVIAMKDPKSGKTSFLWEDYQRWVAMCQWHYEVERSLFYSKFNTSADGVTRMAGPNGRSVHIGAGLREQIAPANKRNYTRLTEKIIRDFIHDLSYNTIATGQRKFVCLTGEFGMDLFDQAMKASAAEFQLVDSVFITGKGQELTLGGQFTTYKGLNGTEITLKHLPLYDDPVHNRKLHPETKRPLESYRMTFLDFGMYDGESNIVKVSKKDRDLSMWHTAGSVDPDAGHSKSPSTLRSNNKDGYTVHFLSECGIMIKNPMACGELILDID